MAANNIDSSLAHRLIKAQFPEWAALPIKPVEFSGWDNRTFHLGDSMTIRLPSQAHYAAQVEKEQFWLPKLSPFLPLPIPKPLAMGKPQAEYPWAWSVYQWIEGETASIDKISDLSNFALKLAEFLKALQAIDSSEGPEASSQNFYRGGSLKIYDAETRQAILNVKNKIESKPLTELWEKALISEWEKPSVWIHGDIAIGNLLVKNGELSAVIDFGQLAIGDPACDLVIAWTLLHGESRAIFKETISIDSKTWERAMGWALWKALIVYAELPGTNHSPIEIEKSRRVIDEMLKDF